MNEIIKTIWMANHGENRELIGEMDLDIGELGIEQGRVVDARETTREESIILPKEPVY